MMLLQRILLVFAVHFLIFVPTLLSQEIGHLRGWNLAKFKSKDQIWPKPWHSVNYHENGYMLITTHKFRFHVVQNTCDVLEAALKRYHKYLLLQRSAGNNGKNGEHFNSSGNFRGHLDALNVIMVQRCQDLPSLGMDEHYELRIDSEDMPNGAALIAHSIWGILRGLETFVQLVKPSEDNNVLQIRSCLISDFPRFPHRGLMIDTARHFLPLKTIFEIIDGMEASKLNALHWHMTDDAAFPYRSVRFPEISDMGAFHPYSHVYSANDVKSVIEYSKMRGIRVIPEFDTPAHMRSWGNAYPQLLTACYDSNGEPDASLGPINPTTPFAYDFIKELFTELSQVFLDLHMHLGGDEVKLDCWKSNPEVNQYLENNGLSGQHRELEGLHYGKIANITKSLERKGIVWQDLFDNKAANLDSQTIIQIRKYEDYREELQKVTKTGHLALLSSCWHLDNLTSSWQDMYECDPQEFEGGDPTRVIGGEACMWTEYADHTNIVSRVFPRVSAMAERLWSDKSSLDAQEATRRFEDFRCLLLRRGIGAEPLTGPGFCPGESFNQ